MNNTAMIAILWVATLGLAWFAGSSMGGGEDGEAALTDVEASELREENERLKQELADRGPSLRASSGGVGAGNDGTGDGDGEPRRTKRGPMPAPLSLKGIKDPHVAVAKFQEYAVEMWGRGKEGHLQLLKTFNDLMESGEAEALFRDEQTALPHLYPMIKFLVSNDAHVVDMAETIYETMANDPQSLPEVDDNVIEVFADDGLGPILPGMVSPKRLERFRGYAKKILETPESEQPKAIQRSRHDIARVLRYWQPPMSPEEALSKLQSGEYSPEELRTLLRKLGPDELAKLDLGRHIGPMIAKGDYGAISMLSRMQLDNRQLDELDRHFLDAAKEGRVHAWTIGHYLRSTKRNKWTDSRPLVEAGLEMGGKALFAFANGILQLPERPDKDWVSWALARYDFNEGQAHTLKRAFGIQ